LLEMNTTDWEASRKMSMVRCSSLRNSLDSPRVADASGLELGRKQAARRVAKAAPITNDR